MKHVVVALLAVVLVACEQRTPSPEWFSKLDNPQDKDISSIIFSPADLKNVFTDLREATSADTLLAQMLVPVLRFEYYEFPEGPGIVFSLRCAGMSEEGLACVPLKDGCRCFKGKEGLTELQEPPVRYCELVKEKFLPKWFCEGNCKEEGKTCFPLMLYDKQNRKSGGVAGCICLPLEVKPVVF